MKPSKLHNYSHNVSVVIVTYSRLFDLLHCVGSIMTQSVNVTEINVVCGGLENITQSLQALQKHSKIPIHIVRAKNNNVSMLRNLGIEKSSCQLVAFLDDDCVAHRLWMESYATKIKNLESISAFVGGSKTYYCNNAYSLLTAFDDYIWKKNGSKHGYLTDFKTLDTKNVVFNKKFIQKHKMRFDERMAQSKLSSIEDSDFGIQIEKKGGTAVLVQSAVVWHKDPISSIYYWKKNTDKYKNYIKLKKKWLFQNHLQDYSIVKELNIFSKMYELSTFSRFRLYVLLCVKVIVDKVLYYTIR